MRLTLALIAALAAAPALAHDGHHETLGLAAQVGHLITQPDHLLAIAALVVLGVVGSRTWRRRQRVRVRVRRK